MKLCTAMILVTSLTACSYRYGAGYFAVNDKKESDPSHYPTTLSTAEPAEEDCEQVIEQLEITNKLDNANNTITTTAVTKRDRSRKCP